MSKEASDSRHRHCGKDTLSLSLCVVSFIIHHSLALFSDTKPWFPHGQLSLLGTVFLSLFLCNTIYTHICLYACMCYWFSLNGLGVILVKSLGKGLIWRWTVGFWMWVLLDCAVTFWVLDCSTWMWLLTVGTDAMDRLRLRILFHAFAGFISFLKIFSVHFNIRAKVKHCSL